MSTSSGSRVRRLGTMAMSSNPYARRPDLPIPISISAMSQPIAARLPAGEPRLHRNWRGTRRYPTPTAPISSGSAAAEGLQDLLGDLRVHLVDGGAPGVAGGLDHAAPADLLDRVEALDQRPLRRVGRLVADVGERLHELA